MLGYGGYAALTALGVALRERLWRRAASVLLDGKHAREASRFGGFLAAALLAHNSVMHATRGLDAKTPWGHYRGALAGAAGGAALAIAPPGFSRPATLLLMVRAFEVSVRNAARRGWVPDLPHADVALMSLASARVMYCWIFQWPALDPGYHRFIMRIGGVSREQLDALATVLKGRKLDDGLHARFNAALPPGVAPLRVDAWRHRGAEARVMHNAPQKSSLRFLAEYWPTAILRSLRMYLPVYAVPAVVLRLSEIVSDPAAWAQKAGKEVAVGSARSALFLGSFCAIGWGAVLGISKIGGNARVVGGRGAEAMHGTLSGALCGLAVLLEKRSRRIELALFVFSHALRTGWRGTPLTRRTKDRVETLATVPLGMCAVAAMTHAFVRHPESVRRSYLKIMRRLLDDGSGKAQRRKLLWPFVQRGGASDGGGSGSGSGEAAPMLASPVGRTGARKRIADLQLEGSSASFTDWHDRDTHAADGGGGSKPADASPLRSGGDADAGTSKPADASPLRSGGDADAGTSAGAASPLWRHAASTLARRAQEK